MGGGFGEEISPSSCVRGGGELEQQQPLSRVSEVVEKSLVLLLKKILLAEEVQEKVAKEVQAKVVEKKH